MSTRTDRAVQGFNDCVMSDSENKFIPILWDERFKNIKEDVEEIKKTVADLSKLMILTIIGITGWALVQLYAQLATNAHAEVPTHLERLK